MSEVQLNKKKIDEALLNFKKANYNALNAANMIRWKGSYFRNDIGWRAIKREENE